MSANAPGAFEWCPECPAARCTWDRARSAWTCSKCARAWLDERDASGRLLANPVRTSLLPDRPLTPEERAAHDDEPRPGVWAGESGADLRALTQEETDALIRAELWHNVPPAEQLELKGVIGELQRVLVAAGKAKEIQISAQRGGIDSDPLVRLLAYRAWGDRDRSGDARIAEAEKRLSGLFKELQDYPTVSAWCGPGFDYDLHYHELLDVRGLDPPRAARLRRRALVAMLMACLNPLEEHYSMGLASDRARCLSCLDALAPADADEARLVSIVRAAFEAVPRRDELDNIDMFTIDRDARWVHARFVKDALDELDSSTDDPP